MRLHQIWIRIRHQFNRFLALLDKGVALKLLIGLFPFILVATLFFYGFESKAGTSEYRSYGAALKGIIVLMFSGFDIQTPVTIGGYISAISVLLSGIVFGALVIGDSAAMLVHRRLRGEKGMKKPKVNQHILLCGWNHHGKSIVSQLLSEDFNDRKDIVIAADLDESPYHDARVRFVKGNPTENEILLRSSVDKASTTIILGGDGDIQVADAQVILTALAIENLQPDLYTCAIIFDDKNKIHLQHANVDEIVCTSEMTDGLIVQASLNHGLSALLSNLLTFSEGCEIYKVRLTESYLGLTFAESANKMLNEEKITLIGVETDVLNSKGKPGREVFFLPNWSGSLKERDCAFIIAESFPNGFECA